jgi:mRNA interferase MazF
MNIGVEIYGKGPKFTRPVLVLKKFNADGFLGVPLTSHRKVSDWYAPVVCVGVEGSAVLNQIRAFDAKRLLTRMGTLSDKDFQSIKQAFADPHKP